MKFPLAYQLDGIVRLRVNNFANKRLVFSLILIR